MWSAARERLTEAGPETTLWASENEYRFSGLPMRLVAPFMRGAFRKQLQQHMQDFRRSPSRERTSAKRRADPRAGDQQDVGVPSGRPVGGRPDSRPRRSCRRRARAHGGRATTDRVVGLHHCRRDGAGGRGDAHPAAAPFAGWRRSWSGNSSTAPSPGRAASATPPGGGYVPTAIPATCRNPSLTSSAAMPTSPSRGVGRRCRGLPCRHTATARGDTAALS
jgi:hypothetical protein